MMRRAFSLALLGLPLLAGCAETGDYPRLLPMDEILTAPGPVSDPAAVQAALHGGAAGLRARAAALSGPVIDPATRARMAAMADRHR